MMFRIKCIHIDKEAFIPAAFIDDRPVQVMGMKEHNIAGKNIIFPSFDDKTYISTEQNVNLVEVVIMVFQFPGRLYALIVNRLEVRCNPVVG